MANAKSTPWYNFENLWVTENTNDEEKKELVNVVA